MKRMTLDEWRAEAVRRFGADSANWKFVCPACGHVQSIRDFLDIELDQNDAYQNCVGRFTGKGSPKKGDTSGCNWAAYGLLGTLGNGVEVDDGGCIVEVFDFAEGNGDNGDITRE